VGLAPLAEVELFTAPADPALDPGGVAIGQRIVGNIPGDHCPRTDEGILADGIATDDGGICPDAGPLFDQRELELMFS
jgi:hypothetical protein